MTVKSKRSRTKYPGLVKEVNLKIRQEHIDQDYIHKLSESEKQWLNNFNEEYVSANFTHPGKRIHPKKVKTRVVKSTGEKKKVDLYKQECEHRNNHRNNDVYAVAKANGILKKEKVGQIHLETNQSLKPGETEDLLNSMIDLKRVLKKEM